jgi:GNAT superfamily N-acetyltransferase
VDAIVRRATTDDLPCLLELVEEYCAADAHPFEHDTARAGLEPLLEGDGLGVVLVVEVDGTVDGYGVVTWGWSVEIGGLDVVLDELYVRTRGRGLGSKLIAALEDDCRARGVRRIFLETELANEAARRLYARHGYAADTSIWMAKELS